MCYTLSSATPGVVYNGTDDSVVPANTKVQGATVRMQPTFTYEFHLHSVQSSHPLFITETEAGVYDGANALSDGVVGQFAVSDQVLSFTPQRTFPQPLYYGCANHEYMGGKIVIY